MTPVFLIPTLPRGILVHVLDDVSPAYTSVVRQKEISPLAYHKE